MSTAKVYAALLENMHLSEKHLAELVAKRGIPESEIEWLMFRSGGPYVKDILNRFLVEYPLDDLLEASLVQRHGNQIILAEMLLEDRLIIPYWNENEQLTVIRPHKLGLKGARAQVFSGWLAAERPEHIVLTEGEFKTLALHYLGIPSLAVPGVSSFVGDNFARLEDFLKRFGIQHITVMFDNDEKNNPALPQHYKPRPEQRYDTQYYAWLIAERLGKVGFRTDIAWLPDSWRRDGKVDPDMAITELKKTKADFDSLIASAQTPTEFLHSQPDEARKVLLRKIEALTKKLHVQRGPMNQYQAIRKHQDNDGLIYETISDFVVDITTVYRSAEGIIREAQFVNKNGQRSEPFELRVDDMVSVTEFRKFCYRSGEYNFRGKGNDLQAIWELEMSRGAWTPVDLPDVVGEVKPGLWVFGNVAVSEGKVIPADDQGVFWLEGQGIKPRSLALTPTGESMPDALPMLREHTSLTFQQIAAKMKQSVGGYEPYIGIGWAVATLFRREIFTQFKSFPFLFVHGKRQAGKSEFVRWMMAFLGRETEGANIEKSSDVYIQRMAAYYSGLGVALQEYRNSIDVQKKDGLLRSIYDGQVTGKGVREAFGTRSTRVRAGIIIDGEELPADSALVQRLVPVSLSRDRRDDTQLPWIRAKMDEFSALTLQILRDPEPVKQRMWASIKRMQQYLQTAEVSGRLQNNWAIFAGAAMAVLGEDLAFMSWVKDQCHRIEAFSLDRHALEQFYTDLMVMLEQGLIGPKYIHLRQDGQIALWLDGVYPLWSEFMRRTTGRPPFDLGSIKNYLNDESYAEARRVYFGRRQRRAWTLNINNAPDVLQELAGSLQDDEEADQPEF